jgi:3-oxoadipate enol-lactonase
MLMNLAYDSAGAGTPIVFLHGFPHTRTLWAPQLDALGRQFRCIAPDLRGFGESEARPPYSMDQYADDIAHLLDTLGIERAVVGGLSMGGYIAFAFWRRHRERVRALILADTRSGADSAEGRQKRRDTIALARTRGAGAVADAMIEGMVGKSTRRERPKLVRSVHAMLASAPVEGIVGALEAMMTRPDSTPTLATIDVPTLIVVGDEDVLTPPAESRAMQGAIPGSRLAVIPAAGHVSNLERPEEFNRTVGEFMAQNG